MKENEEEEQEKEQEQEQEQEQEEEEEEEGICMAAAGFIFLASKLQKEETNGIAWVRPALRRRNVLTSTYLLHYISELLNPCY